MNYDEVTYLSDTILILITPKTSYAQYNTNTRSNIKSNHLTKYV